MSFWQTKSLAELNEQEWEQVCDGCGLCCLHKLEDEDDGKVYYTDVACAYLDTNTAQCSDYPNRKTNVPHCLHLTPYNIHDMNWLPETCGYRRLHLKQDLPNWHPLITGSAKTVPVSVAGRCVSETTVTEDELAERIVQWVLA